MFLEEIAPAVSSDDNSDIKLVVQARYLRTPSSLPSGQAMPGICGLLLAVWLHLETWHPWTKSQTATDLVDWTPSFTVKVCNQTGEHYLSSCL